MASPQLQQAQRDAANQTKLTPVAPGPSAADLPNWRCPAFARMKPDWETVLDVCGGTKAIRKKRTKYLPQMELETDKDYAERLERTELLNGTARTIKGLTGMIFRYNPVLGDDIPSEIKIQWENIDNAGTHGDVFAKRLADDGWKRGHIGILVDYPTVENPQAMTRATEKGLRPYWIKVLPEQILNWRIGVANGEVYLKQITIEMTMTEDVGAFGQVDAKEYRVYHNENGTITLDIWREDPNTKRISKEKNALPITNQKVIPLAIAYLGDKVGELESAAPLIDLAMTNIAHYQVRSDHRHSLHKASVPILVIKGRPNADERIEVGVNSGLDVPVDGDVKYVEHQGKALEATRQELQDLVSDMAAMGLAMLQRETRSAETATGKMLDKQGENSALASAARSLQDALEAALQFHAAFMGKDSGGSIVINKEFEALTLDAQMINSLSQLEVAGQITLDTLWAMLESGHTLPEDFDAAKEREALDLKKAQDVLDAQKLFKQQGSPPPQDQKGQQPGGQQPGQQPPNA